MARAAAGGSGGGSGAGGSDAGRPADSHSSNSSSKSSPEIRSAGRMNSRVVTVPFFWLFDQVCRIEEVRVADLGPQRVQRHRPAAIDREVEELD